MKEYLDVYEGVKLEILYTTKFDENLDLSTIYLGRINMTRSDTIMVEERFSISEKGYTIGKLLYGTECQILLVIGASKSFMSRTHYLRCETFHSLPKFTSKIKNMQVWNGQYVRVLFIIPVTIDIYCHRYEMFLLMKM